MPGPARSWLTSPSSRLPDRQLHLDVPADEAELAADLLWAAGATAIEERPIADRVLLISDPPDARTVTARWHGTWVEVDDRVLDGWREWALPVRAGHRIVVHPAWQSPPEVDPDDVVISLDPGRAFGSGSHPTTRLALAALERYIEAGDRVLDLGCGSGVLAVAAARLGAADVDAVDIDDAALDATAANARANGVDVRTAMRPSADRYDLVVANISAPALIELAPSIDARTVILSGFLTARRDAVVAAYADRYAVGSDAEEDGWASAVLVQPGSMRQI